MSKSELLEIHGIGEDAAEALVKDGVTTTDELERALRELEPPARHIYSSFQLDVLDEFDLPKIGGPSVSQYTQRIFSNEEIVYEWKRDTETLAVELQKEEDMFRAEWTSTSEEKPLRSGLYEQRSDAVKALTRWAYRPPGSA